MSIAEPCFSSPPGHRPTLATHHDCGCERASTARTARGFADQRTLAIDVRFTVPAIATGTMGMAEPIASAPRS